MLTFAIAATWAAEKEGCALGYAGNPCTPCPAGQSTAIVGDSRGCKPCPGGQFSSSPGSRCLGCEYGKFSSAEGATSCEGRCDPGYSTMSYGARSKEQCQACAAGKFNAERGGTCQACEPGTSAAAGSRSCQPCEPGWSTDGRPAGQGSCSRCKPGSYSPRAGEAQCTPCPRSTYGNVAGAASEAVGCRRCPAGHETSGPGKAHQSSCTRCAVGTYIAPNGPHCVPCPAGTYNDGSNNNPNKEDCRPCPSNAPYSLAGATSAAECSTVPLRYLKVVAPCVAVSVLLLLCATRTSGNGGGARRGDDLGALFRSTRDWPTHKHLHDL